MRGLLAFLASGLLGMLLGRWTNPVVEPGFGAPVVAAASGSPGQFPVEVVIVLSIVLVLLLLWRRRAPALDHSPRDRTTGLYQPAFVAESLRNQFARDDREGRSHLALVLIEIDDLETLRGRYGRTAVDSISALLGQRIGSQVRAGDLPMRVSDSRYAVYLQCDELEQAAAFSRRVAMLLSRDQLEFRGDVVKLTTRSVNVLRSPGESPDSLLERAGQGLDGALVDTRPQPA